MTFQEEHRAKFTIAVNHNENYSAISNTKVSFNQRIDDGFRTFFSETSPLSPSSLAFFISGFEHDERETSNGIGHIVSVRQTETDYTKMLFDMTEMIIPAVEFFMRVNLPDKILNSVALPNFDNDIGAFYGLNYYRFVFSD